MSRMSTIENAASEPIEFFKSLMKQVGDQRVIMNIATLDSQYGLLNRSVLYRGIVDDCIVFVTERNSRKYENLMKDKRICATMTFADLPAQLNDVTGETCRDAHWQVRLMDACAVELNEQQIAGFWKDDPVFAKIRSMIMECGKPCDPSELKQKHDKIMQDYKAGINTLPQTKTFTAFKIVPKQWDFYMSEEECIGDRVQYQLQSNNKWDIKHVCA